MAELWLVCEGEPGSVDIALLQPIFANMLAAEIVVEPACGSSTSVVATFLQMRRGGLAAYLNDRDYFPRAAAETAMTDGKRGFLWRRHSIENYLLPAPVILRGFGRLRERFERFQRPLPPWFAALPTHTEQVAVALRECAGRRAAQEACRLATHRLWAALPASVGQVQKRDPPVPTALGPLGPEHWREALCQEIERVRDAAAQTAGAVEFTRAAVIPLFDAAFAEITAGPYVAALEFLIDFHGRDLLKEFAKGLNSAGVPLTYRRLLEVLIPAAVEEYQANRTIYGQDDFLHLANGVRALAGLDPLA